MQGARLQSDLQAIGGIGTAHWGLRRYLAEPSIGSCPRRPGPSLLLFRTAPELAKPRMLREPAKFCRRCRAALNAANSSDEALKSVILLGFSRTNLRQQSFAVVPSAVTTVKCRGSEAQVRVRVGT